MKKLLSMILALTILIVPVGANTCMAEGGANENHQSVSAPQAQKKKSSHKLLFLAILGAALGASASAMNKYCADGQFGMYVGTYAVKGRSLVKLNWNKLNEFIKNNPTLNKLITDCANYLSTTKENLLKNLGSFKEVYLEQ